MFTMNVLLCLIYFQLLHPCRSKQIWLHYQKGGRLQKKTAPETLQRSQTHRQTKSINRRNNRDIRVVNDEDSNRSNEGSHTNEQLQSIPTGIPTIDYALLAREIIKQQGLMNSNNYSPEDQLKHSQQVFSQSKMLIIMWTMLNLLPFCHHSEQTF